MKLFNLNGNLLETFHTNLGNQQSNISITRRGELAFTDKSDCTVNIVKNKQIQEIVKLQGWMPQNVCYSYFGDFLVVMQSDDRKHTKVVRYAGSTEILKVFNLITEEKFFIHLAFYVSLRSFDCHMTFSEYFTVISVM